MSRRIRRALVFIVVVVLVGGAAVVVLTTEPGLADARDRVDATWTPLRKPLQLRYQQLAGVEQAVTTGGGGHRAVIKDLRAVFNRWAKLAGKPDSKADPGAEAQTANQLEALATRLRTNVLLSDRLKNQPPINDAIKAFATAVVPTPALDAYNRAVRDYQDTREGTPESLVAAVFGFGERPLLVVG
jgi:hypothetical protein